MTNVLKLKKWCIAVTLAVFLTGLWSMSGTFDSGDALNRLRVTDQVFTPGGLVVASQGKPERGGYSLFVDQNGTYISSWGPGQPLLFVPYHLISVAVTQPLAAQFRWSNADVLRVKRFIVSSLVSLSCLLLIFWLEILVAMALGCDQWLALGIATLATFGSIFWSMWKQGQEEVQLGICFLGMIYGWLRWQKSLNLWDQNLSNQISNDATITDADLDIDTEINLNQDSDELQRSSLKWVWFSSVMVAIALLFRTTALPMVLGSIWLFVINATGSGIMQKSYLNSNQNFWQRWRWLIIPQGICNGIAIAIVAGYNFIKTGNPLKAGVPLEDFHGSWFAGLTEPIWGIDKGIIWTNPWLLPALIITVVLWRYLSANHRQLLTLTLFLFIASITIYANWLTWAGDHAYGARFQVHLVPGLTVLLGSAIGLHGSQLGAKLAEAHQSASKSVFGASGFIAQMTARFLQKISLKVTILILTSCILFQIPSISLIHNLEIYQAIRSGIWQNSTTVSPTQYLPQVPHRYQNFWIKLTTQAKVLPLPPSVPITGDSQRRFMISDKDYDGAQRWNFWPWLIPSHLTNKLGPILLLSWYVLVVLSIGLWLVLAYWIAATKITSCRKAQAADRLN